MANVSLSKLPKVNLSKNQVVSLTKDGSKNSSKLRKVFVGANWSAIGGIPIVSHIESTEGGFFSKLFGTAKKVVKEVVSSTSEIIDVDLDSSLIMYDKNYQILDTVYFGKLLSSDGSVKHSGDDLTGDKNGGDDLDNEVISIDLDKVSPKCKYIVSILNSYQCRQKFDEIPFISLRIYSNNSDKPSDVDEVLASYKLDNNPEFKGKYAIVLGVFYKNGDTWEFKADGTSTNERNISDIRGGSALSAVKRINI